MRKWICVGMVLILMITMSVPVVGTADDAVKTDENGYMYTVENGEATIVGYSGMASILTTPTMLEGFPVTAIAEEAFRNSYFSTITISSGVKTIGDRAFAESFVKTVTLPDTVTTIGTATFAYCEYLRNINLDHITTIGDEAFRSCYKLSSVTLPDCLEVIGNNVFSSCYELTELTIPAAVRSIGTPVVVACDAFTGFTVSEENPYYCAIDGLLYTKDRSKVISCVPSRTTCFLPSSVTVIGEYAFANSYIKSIALPDGVKTIEKGAFQGSSLEVIIIPQGVAVIEESVFEYAALRSVHIPASVVEIKESAFHLHNSYKTVSVYYEGEQSEWEQVVVADGNYKLATQCLEYYYEMCYTGDVNLDETVNMQDVMCAYNAVAGVIELNALQWRMTNVDYGPTVNIMDVVLLYRRVAGLEDRW